LHAAGADRVDAPIGVLGIVISGFGGLRSRVHLFLSTQTNMNTLILPPLTPLASTCLLVQLSVCVFGALIVRVIETRPGKA
jgi:hypothetical protein